MCSYKTNLLQAWCVIQNPIKCLLFSYSFICHAMRFQILGDDDSDGLNPNKFEWVILGTFDLTPDQVKHALTMWDEVGNK